MRLRIMCLGFRVLGGLGIRVGGSRLVIECSG